MTHRRIMLKLSGEVFAPGDGTNGIDAAALHRVAETLREAKATGAELAVVVGGGNVWRYRDKAGMEIDRVKSDFLGMTATVMNGVALGCALERIGVPVVVLSALTMPELAPLFTPEAGRKALDDGKILVCAGGTGTPYVTTDSAAARRAVDVGCTVLLKASTVDGVYDKDPDAHPDAVRFDELTFDEAIERKLAVMDEGAFALCKENGVSIRVFDFGTEGALLAAVKGEAVGTLVH